MMEEIRFKAGILTMSDKGSRGERVDESGALASRMLEADGFEIVEYKIVPDKVEEITGAIRDWCDIKKLSLIVTSGGTGLSPSDVTPQAMSKILDFEVPGMAEAMRAESLKKTPHAMISRAMAGVRGTTLIVNLPGSPKGVKENLEVVLPALKHAISKLTGDNTDCATPLK
jgi:molybdenum cofactor synthesis domain-containing protein